MKTYTATLSFADATHGYAPGQDYELDEADAAHYVELGWLVPVEPEAKPAAKRNRKPKVEKAIAPAAVETATLDS